MLDAGALIAVADLEAWDPVRDFAPDDLDGIEAAINAASGMIQRYCRRVFRRPATAITETHDGDGGTVLHLKRPPVASITSVTVDGVALASSGYAVARPATDPDVEVDFNDGRLIRTTGAWSVGVRNIAVVYLGGWAATPPAVAEACCQLAAHLLAARGRDVAVQVEEAGDFRQDRRPTGTVDAIPASIRARLEDYRLPMPGGLPPDAYERTRSSGW